MVTFYTYAQALRLYRAHKLRVPVQLSALALRKARARATSVAGLRELSVASLPSMVRGTFQSETEFQNELNAMRVTAHTAQVQVEMHA